MCEILIKNLFPKRICTIKNYSNNQLIASHEPIIVLYNKGTKIIEFL